MGHFTEIFQKDFQYTKIWYKKIQEFKQCDTKAVAQNNLYSEEVQQQA